MFFDILSVKLNAEKTIGLTQRVCFSFDSGVIKTITLRNGIAEISSKNTNCDIQIRTSEQVFKEALAGVRNPVMSVASGEIDTDGQRTKFLGFLSNFSE
jgi:alkyl sulfatase BDS1-like metallo-beta-lactamase superfamily hydrolase